MNDNKGTNESTQQELTKERIAFLGWDWGSTPYDIVSSLYTYFNNIGEACEECPAREVEQAIEESKQDPNFLGNKQKECFVDKPFNSVFEYIVQRRFGDGLFDDEFFELTDFCDFIFPLNARSVYDFFYNTNVFPIVLEGLGILDRVYEAQGQLWSDYNHCCHFQNFTKEKAIEQFGTEAGELFDTDKEPEYEEIVKCYLHFREKIEKISAPQRLIELAILLRAYKEFFLDSIDFKKIETRMAKMQSELNNSLSKIPPENRTAPVSLKRMAECWGGDMTPKKLKGLIKSGLVTAAEMNRQTYVFDATLLPESAVKAIKI